VPLWEGKGFEICKKIVKSALDLYFFPAFQYMFYQNPGKIKTGKCKILHSLPFCHAAKDMPRSVYTV